MNKLGYRKYVQLVADILTNEYGDTLRDYGTDVKMAEAVVKGLDEFLYFHEHDLPYNEFRKWKKERKQTRSD